MRMRTLAVVIGCLVLSYGSALACPSGQSKGMFGWCYPNIGGEVGNAWEKGKRELANFEQDARTWIETGKCGGDICDAFDAVIHFGKDQVSDLGERLKQAEKRIREGKPLDAVWHLTTDFVDDAQENAAVAATRSRVLMAIGQAAASAYGAPYGSAAYTAWLTYNITGDLGDALKAGIISGLTSATLQDVQKIDLEGSPGLAARTALTGAINGTAVALAGGSESEIRAAAGYGAVSVIFREGYKKLTKHDLNNKRLLSSTGSAYCLAETPVLADFSGPKSSCLAPLSLYKQGNDGKYYFDETKFPNLDPDRPHLGLWAKADGASIAEENSKFMTTLSRLPGANAASLGHDAASIQMRFDVLPQPLAFTANVVSIPPAFVATYVGTGLMIHDQIRDTYTGSSAENSDRSKSGEEANTSGNELRKNSPATTVSSAFGANDPGPTEILHLACGMEGNESGELLNRTDLLVSVAADGVARGKYGHLCHVAQFTAGEWYKLGHAHYERNYCHRVAERIAKDRLQRGHVCVASTGLKSTTKPQ